MPGAPLEIRCAWDPSNKYCFTSTALTSKIWLIYEDDAGEWQAKAVADIGDPSSIPLPVDISITADDKGLWVDTFMEGKARYFDISDPHAPKQVYEKQIGSQINMVSQSWDGKRVYFSSSLLGNWDKTGDADEQYVKLYHWDGNELDPPMDGRLLQGRPWPLASDALRRVCAVRQAAADRRDETGGGGSIGRGARGLPADAVKASKAALDPGRLFSSPSGRPACDWEQA